MSNLYSIINGAIVSAQDATISISDLSIQRGYGIFDYFRFIHNQPVFLEEHLNRFYHSAKVMHLPVAQNRDELTAMILELQKRNNLPDSGIRITLTGGYSPDGYNIAQPNLLITQSAFTYNKDNFYKGIRVITYEHQRQLPQVKTIDYLKAIYLQPHIKEHHADDVLYYNQEEVTECPRANFFIVNSREEVITPGNHILRGITREKLLGMDAFRVKEGFIKTADLATAREAFITSTTKNILPVLEINGKPVGDGQPGPITTALFNQLFAFKEIY
ncbi:MAG: aminotransferase class IV [Sphingobacteriia bacterium]|nr:aminotransferase class IV [Sphingobacteriia bacterium]